MEYRQLGDAGLMVSAMAPGTMTFGGKNKFAEVGTVGVDEARSCCISTGITRVTPALATNSDSAELHSFLKAQAGTATIT